MRIREQNSSKVKDEKKKPLFEYQSKKRLNTMSLLKNKVPHQKIEDDYLTKDEIYVMAKKLYRQRILENQKKLEELERVSQKNNIKFAPSSKKSTLPS
jgi:hypothetical protein